MLPHTSPPRNAISTPFLQSMPFRLKSLSVPFEAKIFKAEDIANVLIVELENVTISELASLDPLQLEYVRVLLDSSAVLRKVSLQLNNLKDAAGKLFYRKGSWSPHKVPFFLHHQSNLDMNGAASRSCATRPLPSQGTSDPLSGRATRRSRSSGSLAPKAWTLSRSLRHQSIQRKVGSGSETEVVEGIFISSAGKDEEDTVVWLNSLATSFQSIVATVPIQAVENGSRPRTHAYIQRTLLVLADVTPKRLWSAQFTIKPISGAMKIKPDLILCASDPLNKTVLTWMHVITFIEVTSKPNDPDMSLNLA